MANDDDWVADDSALTAGFLGHHETARGAVRYALVDEQLRRHMPPAPARVLDLGAGEAQISIRLAAEGYEVILADPLQAMRDIEAANIARLDVPVAVRIFDADHRNVVEKVGAGHTDAVLCHGVAMYLDSTGPILEACTELLSAGGIASLLVLNGSAVAMRPGLKGDYERALRVLGGERDTGVLGVKTRGDTVEQLTDEAKKIGFQLVEWYGVRIFSDHLGQAPIDGSTERLIELERQAADLDPYRGIGRLLHFVFRKP